MRIKSKSYISHKSYIWCIQENHPYLIGINPNGWNVKYTIILDGFGYTNKTKLVALHESILCVNLSNGIIMEYDTRTKRVSNYIQLKSTEYADVIKTGNKLLCVPKSPKDSFMLVDTEKIDCKVVTVFKDYEYDLIGKSKICNVLLSSSNTCYFTFQEAPYIFSYDLQSGVIGHHEVKEGNVKCVIETADGDLVFSYREASRQLLVYRKEKGFAYYQISAEEEPKIIRLLEIEGYIFAISDTTIYMFDQAGHLVHQMTGLKAEALQKSMFMYAYKKENQCVLMPYGAMQAINVDLKSGTIKSFDIQRKMAKLLQCETKEQVLFEGGFSLNEFLSFIKSDKRVVQEKKYANIGKTIFKRICLDKN